MRRVATITLNFSQVSDFPLGEITAKLTFDLNNLTQTEMREVYDVAVQEVALTLSRLPRLPSLTINRIKIK